jgi:hypothetical protein
MNPGSHEHPVRPQGAGRRQRMFGYKRRPMWYTTHDDEALTWLRPQSTRRVARLASAPELSPAEYNALLKELDLL